MYILCAKKPPSIVVVHMLKQKLFFIKAGRAVCIFLDIWIVSLQVCQLHAKCISSIISPESYSHEH